MQKDVIKTPGTIEGENPDTKIYLKTKTRGSYFTKGRNQSFLFLRKAGAGDSLGKLE